MSAEGKNPWKASKNGIVLQVRLIPRAVKTAILEIKPEYVKIAIQAPPVDNRANTALIIFLAERLSIPKSYVTIKSGDTSRTKLVEISGVVETTFENAIRG